MGGGRPNPTPSCNFWTHILYNAEVSGGVGIVL